MTSNPTQPACGTGEGAEGRRDRSRLSSVKRSALALASAGAIVALLPITAAGAATHPYDRTNPETTGCANSAYTVGSVNLKNTAGTVIGLLELRYSTVCGTNWARVDSYVGNQYLYAFAHRPGDGATTKGADGDPGPWYTTVAYSDQLYGYRRTVCAVGGIGGSSPATTSYWNNYCA